MVESLWEGLRSLLGLDMEELGIGHMLIRAVVVYFVGLLLVRLGEKRFIGKHTAFDVILGIMLGSVLSRAITGSSPFFPTLGAALAMVVLHWLVAMLSFHSDWFGDWVKGTPRQLIANGEIQWEVMRKSHISRLDLITALRTNAKLSDPSEVKEAYLERNGDISVIPRN